MSGPLAAGASPTKLASWIEPSRTALLIIDMQVDFASPSGAVGVGGTDLGDVPAALAAASRLAQAAREAGVRVVFVHLETREETDSAAWAERIRRRGGLPGKALALCRAGTPGADFCGPHPAEGDLAIAKSRYSAFFGTDLNARLKARGIDTLVVCGLTTDCCVDCTVRDAFHLDYHVILAADACAAYDSRLHGAALQSLETNFAILAAADDVIAAWGLSKRMHR
jgi:ureidoacrylate peracid hydrolase